MCHGGSTDRVIFRVRQPPCWPIRRLVWLINYLEIESTMRTGSNLKIVRSENNTPWKLHVPRRRILLGNPSVTSLFALQLSYTRLVEPGLSKDRTVKLSKGGTGKKSGCCEQVSKLWRRLPIIGSDVNVFSIDHPLWGFTGPMKQTAQIKAKA